MNILKAYLYALMNVVIKAIKTIKFLRSAVYSRHFFLFCSFVLLLYPIIIRQIRTILEDYAQQQKNEE
jgi:hypothetical protein